MFKRDRKRTPVYERLMKRTIIPIDKNDCWIWTGPVNNAGFGMIKEDLDIDNKMVTVHRVAARQKGLNMKKEINHTCLNKRCVNPNHLIEGSAKQRHTRIVEKHGVNFNQPKDPILKCPHCKGSSHVTWFSRKHANCYPGMFEDYAKLLRKKV